MANNPTELGRFEQWFKMTYPLWNAGRDSITLKHQLWTAWQVAAIAALGENGKLANGAAGMTRPKSASAPHQPDEGREKL